MTLKILRELVCVGLLFLLIVVVVFSGPPATILAEGLSPSEVQALNGWTNWVSDNGSNSLCSSSFGGSLDTFMQIEALLESNNNIKAGTPEHASGKYQFEPATWQSATSHYYGPGQQYAYASAAPESVQDAVMYLRYISVYKSLKGDIFKLAVYHYLPAALSDPSLMDKIPAGGNTLTPREYGNLAAKDAQDGNVRGVAISSVKLYYTAAPDFQTWLAKAGGAATQIGTDTSAPATSSCGTGAGNFVFYDQCDSKWGSHSYGDAGDTICSSGCGPTSVAMVVATLSNSSVTPVQVADWSMAHGGWAKGQGSSWSLFTTGPQHWGLKSVSLGTNFDKAIAILKGGGLVIASGNGAAPFTSVGHIIVLKAVTADGKIVVGDPDTQHTQTTYSVNDIVSAGLRGLWGVTQ